MIRRSSVLLFFTAAFIFSQSVFSQESENTPPKIEREFRGAWVATVYNIDWPSKKGLPTEEQKKELLTILDKASSLHLNAILLQVRPACDAFYESKLEPWSEFLTGEMGHPPKPYYDPLTFAVDEAHKRNLELHAWFNPYRAGFSACKNFATNHILKTHPALVRRYGKHYWLDPGEPEVQKHCINVIMDVVKRYDVDGIHFDDYFYPYRENDAKGKSMDFPDDTSWERYKKAGGTLERNDWRRENVNMFIEHLYGEIKKQKPWVKLGISPFGIWKNGVPKTTRGLDSHAVLYADSRRWLTNGWVDYFAPQLYWNIEAPEQSYPVLLKWWAEQNVKNRQLCPGLSVSRVGNTRGPEEIINQIKITREVTNACGNIHWSFKSLGRDQKGVSTLLVKNLYTAPALMPAAPWLSPVAPRKPELKVAIHDKFLKVSWQSSEKVSLWVLQTKMNGQWKTEIMPVSERKREIWPKPPETMPDVIALTAIDRYNNASAPAIFTVKK